MPMGIVSDKEFESELENANPTPKKEEVKTGVVITPDKPGRTPGAIEVPQGIRKLIGDESETNGRQSALQLAQEFGLSASSVSAYAVGATSTSTYKDRPNGDVISNARGRIKLKASKKLMLALNGITPDKINESKARDLAGIAKDMSAIVRNMDESDPAKGADPNAPQKPVFQVYAPTFKSENHYQTVIAKE